MPEVVMLGEFCEQRKNGEKIEYIIQTATPEMADDIVALMFKAFVPREPMTMNRILGDEDASQYLTELWKKSVCDGTSLVALLKENGKPTKLIGTNVTPIVDNKPSSSEEKEHPNANFGEVLEALIYIAKKGDIFGRYGVDRYMTGYGLTVDQDYHGYKIGQRLLESRRPLCKKLGIKATGTVFTAAVSQKLAKDVGFELLYEEDYKTFEVNGKKPFETLPHKFQMMGLKFE